MLLPLFSCSVSANDVVFLDSSWEYALSKTGAELPEDVLGYDFYPLPQTYINSLSLFIPEGRGTIWLKRSIPLERAFIIQNPELFLYLGRVTMADETYFNNVLIGKEGRFPPDVFSAWNKFRMYRIPENIVRYKTLNTLLVRVYVEKEGSLTGKPFISGRPIADRQYALDSFLYSSANLIAAGIMFIAGLYHIIIWLKRKRETESLYFAILNILGAFYLSNFFLYDTFLFSMIPVNWLFFQKIVANILIYCIGFTVCAFIISLLKIREKPILLAFRLILLVAPIAWIMLIPTYSELYAQRLYLQLLLIPIMCYILGLIIYGVIKRNPDAKIVIFGMIPLFVTSLLDIVIHSGLQLYDFPYLAGFGFPLVILSIFFLLAGRFAASLTQVEELNLHLEDKVEKRTRELQSTNDQLSDTLAKLREAQYIADRDLKMATYVQTSFYPRTAPKTRYWDSSYFFKPASAVAGDLYDFYIKNSELNGLGLFDVSGHGIASGLVTMLAKTIIFHTFSENSHKKLHDLLDIINNQIIHDKGDIENYLTGILLRLNQHTVEYVNAGHTDLLFCNGSTGKVAPVTDDKNLAKGMFLGIADIPCNAHTLRFKVKPGDLLCLYTDGITEAKNEAGEMFGEELLYSLLESSKNLDARSIVSLIQTRLSEFKGDIPFADDVTVIVLKALEGQEYA